MNMNFDFKEPWNVVQHLNITCTEFGAPEVKHGKVQRALVKRRLCFIIDLAQCFPLESFWKMNYI